jgi:hypothetical protein
MKKAFYWLPRTLVILFIAFISLFAFDVFNEPQWFLALLIHLIPSFTLTAITFLAWRHERSGGFLFLATALTMAVFFRSVIIAVPVFITGLLFITQDYSSRD